jgi:hypothetical protein
MSVLYLVATAADYWERVGEAPSELGYVGQIFHEMDPQFAETVGLYESQSVEELSALLPLPSPFSHVLARRPALCAGDSALEEAIEEANSYIGRSADGLDSSLRAATEGFTEYDELQTEEGLTREGSEGGDDELSFAYDEESSGCSGSAEEGPGGGGNEDY